MTERKKPHLPIGYWLKRADEAITESVNQAQQANGLSRIDWQVLNLLHEVSAAAWEQVAEALGPFADGERLQAVVDDLVARGLVERREPAGSVYQLSEQGRQLHQAALTAQREVRRQAMAGVSESDYQTAVRVLQRMVANLAGDSPERRGAAADPADG